MWIETLAACWVACRTSNSFASNGECGLKLHALQRLCAGDLIHSPAMANVD